MNTTQPSQSNRTFRFVLLSVVLFFAFVGYNAFRQARQLDQLKLVISERVAAHKVWTAIRRAELKAKEDKTANAEGDNRNRLTGEVAEAREALHDAIQADRSEILELWGKVSDSRSGIPMPTFEE